MRGNGKWSGGEREAKGTEAMANLVRLRTAGWARVFPSICYCERLRDTARVSLGAVDLSVCLYVAVRLCGVCRPEMTMLHSRWFLCRSGR